MSGPDGADKPQRSGRVRHDSSGRAIWEWAIESGRHAIDSTSRLLQKLDVTSLRLLGDDEKSWEKKGESDGHGSQESAGRARQPEQPVPTFGGPREADPMAEKRHSFNPYDTRTPTGRGVSRAPKPAAPARPRITQPVRPARKPGLLARLFGRGRK